MTALCPGGGTSSVKPGVGPSIIVSASLITGGLAVISPWLIPFAALIDAFVYEALTNCPTDPPAMPAAADLSPVNAVGGVLNPNFQTWLTAVHDAILNYLWYQFCQCNSGSPSPFVAPPQPPGVTVPTSSATASCFAGSWSGTVEDYHTNPTFHTLKDLLCYPGTDATGVIGTGVSPVRQLNTPIPTGWEANVTVNFADAFSHSVQLEVICYNAAGSFLSGPVLAVPTVANGTSTIQFSGSIPATTKYMYVDILDSAATYHASTANVDLSYTCSGTAPGTPSTPCVSDPAVLTLLQQIWDLLVLVQRQAVPFAYVTSTNHAGLTGDGQIAVQGLLGVKVTPTVTPADAGLVIGDPDELWLDSWITWGNADGWRHREFLTHSPYVSLPELAGQWTLVGYSLRPGLTVTITELKREP